MEDSISTALLNAPISQEVVHSEEYNLAADQSQITVSAKINHCYVDLLEKTSIYALNQIQAEWEIMVKEISPQHCSRECSYKLS